VLALCLQAPAAVAQQPAAQPAPKPAESSLTQAAREYHFELRPAIGVVFPTSPDGEDTGWDIGGSARVIPPKWNFGLQLDLFVVDLSSSLFQATIEAFYEFGDKTKAFRPYIIGGLGIYDGNFGINGGIGVDFAVVHAPFGFFAEARYHNVFTDGDDLGFIPLNAGIRIRF
jgi:hypothetical protein